ncbi:MAG: ferritin-like domain-containing protein [Paracoccaceae bacterium]
MTTESLLSEAEQQGLRDALDDEYKSFAIYAQVIEDFGRIRPFVNIVKAEARHFSALLALFAKCGITPPQDRWRGAAPRFSNAHAACEAAVQGEIDNVAIYDRVLRSTARPDMIAVYSALREASLERHLPAFRRCIERKSL